MPSILHLTPATSNIGAKFWLDGSYVIRVQPVKYNDATNAQMMKTALLLSTGTTIEVREDVSYVLHGLGWVSDNQETKTQE